MENEFIYQDIIKRIEDMTGVAVTDVNVSLFDEGLFADSIAIVTFISEIEKQYQISFEDDLEMSYLDSVALLIKAVGEQLETK